MNNLQTTGFTVDNDNNVKSIEYIDKNGNKVTMDNRLYSNKPLLSSVDIKKNGAYNFNNSEYAGVKTVYVDTPNASINEKIYSYSEDDIASLSGREIAYNAGVQGKDGETLVPAVKIKYPNLRRKAIAATYEWGTQYLTAEKNNMYGYSQVIIPGIMNAVYNANVSGSQDTAGTCDMTESVGRYGSPAHWVMPAKGKFGFQGVYLPNTQLESRYIKAEELERFIGSNAKMVINPSETMFGMASVTIAPLPVDAEKTVEVSLSSLQNGDEIEIVPDNGYISVKKVKIKITE